MRVDNIARHGDSIMMLLVWILSYRNDATGMDPVLS